MDGPPSNAPLLQEFVSDRYAACPNCGYDLRGLRGESCPECGDPLALALSERAPKHTAFAWTAVPPWAGAVYSALLTGANVAYGTEEALRVKWGTVFVLAAAALAFAVPALALWRFHRRVLRMPLPALWLACGASWLASLALTLVIAWVLQHV